MSGAAKRILVTGATGYVGGRLVPCLRAAGYPVRCLARDPERLRGRPWADAVEIAAGDVFHPESLAPALRDVDTAYYLIHSLGTGAGYAERDPVAARGFGDAARRAGVRRILYLGGLGDSRARLSMHLRSRQETGAALRECGVPVTEFRAAVIVGSGSLSFEMIRYLTERIPIMICPRWVFTRTQPIAIADVLAYLVAAPQTPESAGRILEIGGNEVMTYADMMLGYARARGLRRKLLAVPVLTPRLSSYWVHLVTPIPANIAQPLIRSLGDDTVVRDDRARRLFPEIRPADYATAVRDALSEMEARTVETSWTDALTSSQGARAPYTLTTREGLIVERRERAVAAPPAEVYRVFAGLGGARGWLYWDWAWRARGALDRVFGGVGLRRGRRDPEALRAGDALDFWRVEAVEPGHRILLRAEMRMPGRAWLEFRAESRGERGSRLVQTALFDPRGLGGFLYWYALYLPHRFIFRGLCRRIAESAERQACGDA